MDPPAPSEGDHPHGMMSIADPPGNYGEDRYVDGSADARRDIVLETSQRTSRESRHLGQVIGWLTTEFADRIDTEVIKRVAVEEITHLRKARVRKFVATISWRVARARLEDLLIERPIGAR